MLRNISPLQKWPIAAGYKAAIFLRRRILAAKMAECSRVRNNNNIAAPSPAASIGRMQQGRRQQDYCCLVPCCETHTSRYKAAIILLPSTLPQNTHIYTHSHAWGHEFPPGETTIICGNYFPRAGPKQPGRGHEFLLFSDLGNPRQGQKNSPAEASQAREH